MSRNWRTASCNWRRGHPKKEGLFSESGREKKSKFVTAIDSITKECITEIKHL